MPLVLIEPGFEKVGEKIIGNPIDMAVPVGECISYFDGYKHPGRFRDSDQCIEALNPSSSLWLKPLVIDGSVNVHRDEDELAASEGIFEEIASTIASLPESAVKEKKHGFINGIAQTTTYAVAVAKIGLDAITGQDYLDDMTLVQTAAVHYAEARRKHRNLLGLTVVSELVVVCNSLLAKDSKEARSQVSYIKTGSYDYMAKYMELVRQGSRFEIGGTLVRNKHSFASKNDGEYIADFIRAIASAPKDHGISIPRVASRIDWPSYV